MRCTNCGASLDFDSRFCKSCGAPAYDPEETRLAKATASIPARQDNDSDIESVVFTVRPTMLFIKIGYALAVLGAILLTIGLAMISFIDIPWYFSLPVALGLLLIPAYY